MRTLIPKTLAALAFVGAMAIGTAAPSMAQGVYVEGPGVEFGVGPRWHHRYDYRPYYHHHYWRHGYRHWDRD